MSYNPGVRQRNRHSRLGDRLRRLNRPSWPCLGLNADVEWCGARSRCIAGYPRNVARHPRLTRLQNHDTSLTNLREKPRISRTRAIRPLPAYQEQIQRQSISNEMLDADTLRKGFGGLVVPEHYLRKLLPAINAGRTVLLFGPPGNGKTTLATRVASLFKDVVYIPYAVEVAGQIIKIFDAGLHKPLVSEADAATLSGKGGLQRERFDERWVACERPVAIAGGELTLEMLDLQHNPDTKFYDAPLHVKALNGMLLVDDFGRQKFNPDELLNRWIVPMENQIDFLKLNTGTSFSLPFDELLVFSTNLQPSDLMDPAFMRRIPYKIKLFAPDREEYRQIFEGVARVSGLELLDEVFDFVVDRLTVSGKFGLAYYQPKFICEQVVETCRCFNLRPRLTKELAAEALANLYFELEDAKDSQSAL
jgi:hypothetical protein